LRLNPLAAAYPFGELGARLKAARQFKNVALEDAAEACRVDEWLYNDLERGKYPITHAQLIALEALLGIDRHWVETGISPVARLIELKDPDLVGMFGSAVNPDLPEAVVAEGIRRALRARLLVGDVGDIPDIVPVVESVRLADRIEAAGRLAAKGGLFGFLVTFVVLLFAVVGTSFTASGMLRAFMGFASMFLAVWMLVAGMGLIVASVARRSVPTVGNVPSVSTLARPAPRERKKGLAA